MSNQRKVRLHFTNVTDMTTLVELLPAIVALGKPGRFRFDFIGPGPGEVELTTRVSSIQIQKKLAEQFPNINTGVEEIGDEHAV